MLIDELISADESGFACSKTKLVNDGLLHLRPFNIDDDGCLSFSTLYRIPGDAAPAGKAQLEPGDILFNNTNSVELVGKSAIVREPIVAGFSNHLTRIRVRKEKVNPEFFNFLLRSMRIRGRFTAGATQWVSQAAFKTSELRKWDVNLPALEDQRRIVDILSRAEGIVRLRREAEKKAAELIPALFIEMFGDPAVNPKGWPVTTVGASLQIPIRNGISPSKSGRIEGRVLTLSAITRGVFNPLAVKSANFAAQLSDSDEVKSEDFLICRGNGNPNLVGRGCFPHADMPGVAFPDTAIAVRVLPTTFEKGFLETVWETSFVRDQIRAAAKTTNGTYKINQAALAAIALPRPPIDLQRQFAQRVEAIRALQVQQAAATAKAQASFDALLAQAFPA